MIATCIGREDESQVALKVDYLDDDASVAFDVKRKVGQLSILFRYHQLPVIFDEGR